MSDTLADIVRKLRKEADALKVDETCQDLDLIHEEWNHCRRDRLRALADRIEAAHKREMADALDTGAFVEAAHKREKATAEKSSPVGDAAKMREALELASRVIHCAIEANILKGEDAWVAFYACRAALSAPLRNCDVGTLEDQAERSFRFCLSQNGRCKNGCPAYRKGKNCRLVWANLPYEKGGAE